MLTDSEILRRQQTGRGFRLVPLEDWRARLRTGANVLVSGPGRSLTSFIEQATSEMRAPIASVAGSAPLLCDARTLIVTDADRLDAAGQRQLTQWMNEPRHAHAQIVSLTSVNLLALVDASRFDANLFYRLNVIHLKVQEV